MKPKQRYAADFATPQNRTNAEAGSLEARHTYPTYRYEVPISDFGLLSAMVSPWEVDEHTFFGSDPQVLLIPLERLMQTSPRIAPRSDLWYNLGVVEAYQTLGLIDIPNVPMIPSPRMLRHPKQRPSRPPPRGCRAGACPVRDKPISQVQAQARLGKRNTCASVDI